jgi:hypothetical protein
LQAAYIKYSGETIGSLAFKSRTFHKRDLDWAVCIINPSTIPLTNQISLQDSPTPVQVTMAKNEPSDATVLVHYGTGTIGGFILADYSLVALPGQRFAQKMWVIILDREISKHINNTQS